jgi:hypothetical protein
MYPIARSGVTVTRLLCVPLPFKNVLKYRTRQNVEENAVLASSTKCTKRSPRFSRVRYSGSGYRKAQITGQSSAFSADVLHITRYISNCGLLAFQCSCVGRPGPILAEEWGPHNAPLFFLTVSDVLGQLIIAEEWEHLNVPSSFISINYRTLDPSIHTYSIWSTSPHLSYVPRQVP